jgi:hypothetical protein
MKEDFKIASVEYVRGAAPIRGAGEGLLLSLYSMWRVRERRRLRTCSALRASAIEASYL